MTDRPTDERHAMRRSACVPNAVIPASAAIVALTALALMACNRAEPPSEAPPSGAVASAGAPTANTPAANPPAAIPSGTPTAAPPAAPPNAEDPRTPADFARAWAAVRTAPVDERGRAGKALADEWHNGRYTWTAYALAGLCLDATRTCGLNPFERTTTPDLPALGGHTPLFTFTPEAYDRLRRDCADQTGCVITTRAQLTDLVTDPAEPLRLAFTNAEIITTRQPTPTEQWFGPIPTAPAPTRAPNARLRTDATSLRDIPKLAPRVFRAPETPAPTEPATPTPPAAPSQP